MPSWWRSFSLILSMMVIRVVGSLLELHLQIPLTLGVKRFMVDVIPDALQSLISSPSSSSVVQVGALPEFLDQWRSITSNRFILNMVKGHYLQLTFCPPLFHNFRQFSKKAAPAHHPIFHKEMDELLAMGTIESSTGGAIRQVWQLIQQGVYGCSIDLKDAYLHIPFVRHYHHSERFWLFGWLQLQEFSPHSINPYCSFAITRLCVLLFTLMISWYLLAPSMLTSEFKPSCALLVCLGLHISLSNSELHLMQQFLFGLSCERPLWCPMWNPALTKSCKFGWWMGGQSSFDHVHVES